jgi:hypothetical protein
VRLKRHDLVRRGIHETPIRALKRPGWSQDTPSALIRAIRVKNPSPILFIMFILSKKFSAHARPSGTTCQGAGKIGARFRG